MNDLERAFRLYARPVLLVIIGLFVMGLVAMTPESAGVFDQVLMPIKRAIFYGALVVGELVSCGSAGVPIWSTAGLVANWTGAATTAVARCAIYPAAGETTASASCADRREKGGTEAQWKAPQLRGFCFSCSL